MKKVIAGLAAIVLLIVGMSVGAAERVVLR